MKLNINSARKGNSSYTFSPLSLVSLDFGRLQPIMSFGTVVGDSFNNVSGKGLLRCSPQIFPPFGRMNLKSASFFVPDSQIFSWSSAFHSNSVQWRGQVANQLPQFNQYEINDFFISNSFIAGLCSTVSSNPATAPASNTYDFSIPTNTRSSGLTNLTYFKLTPLGWKIYAVFKALGYDFVTFPTDFNASETYAQVLAANSSLISAVPFLAYAKVWNDFFCNSYQSDKNVVSSALQNIYLGKDVVISGTTYYTASSFTVRFDLLLYMLSHMHLPYESNMYTNAWNDVNDPTGTEFNNLNQVNQQSLISPFGSSDEGEFASIDVDNQHTSHRSTANGSGRVSFSQLGHRTLQAFDNFVRRRNLVGSKAVQQLYALFGVQPDEWSKDYVVKLSENSSRVNFSAITSQSDTVNGSNGKPLGAFAGTGLGGFDLQFSYNANTYGTIICLAWLNIDPIMMHGLHPDVLRIKPLDFYTPDFDGKAYRPIPLCEVTGGKALDNDVSGSISTYGFTNMYDDYRNMRDVVAGSFLDDTTRNFAFMRDMTEVRRVLGAFGSSIYPQISEVQYWHIDGSSDITNPFITAAAAGDRFWFCVDWNIKCTRPILSSENSFDLEGEGNLSITKNGDGMA